MVNNITTDTQVCSSCNISKNLSEFSKKNKKNKEGVIVSFTYRKDCKECDNAKGRLRHSQNKERYNETKKIYRENSEKDKLRRKEYKKTDKARESVKKSREKNIEHYRKYQNNYNKNNITVRLRRSFRTRILNSIHKEKDTISYLGSNINIVIKWLEYNFKEEYNWDNYANTWNIDHTICLNVFDLEDENEVFVAFNWKNLMPMNSKKNSSKGNRLYPKLILFQEMKVREFAKKEKIDHLEINNYFNNYSKKFKNLMATHLVDRESP
jgi:hypothetical protein